MKPIFADTAFFLALLNPSEAYHKQALAVKKMGHTHMVVSDYVLLELGSALSNKQDRSMLIALNDQFRTHPTIQLIPATDHWLQAGLALFAKRKDKEWSLTDCTSFAIMKDLGLTKALTSDHHFHQAGFEVLLK